jgi:hypothetical protein
VSKSCFLCFHSWKTDGPIAAVSFPKCNPQCSEVVMIEEMRRGFVGEDDNFAVRKVGPITEDFGLVRSRVCQTTTHTSATALEISVRTYAKYLVEIP